MNRDIKLDAKIKINRARYNLLFMVFMSVINIFFITSSGAIVVPYSFAISNYSMVFGIGAANENGNETIRILGLVIACSVLLFISICYILSKNKPAYLVISFALVVADMIALIAISATTETFGQVIVILDLLVHILQIVYIFNAIKAYNRLISIQASVKNNTSDQTPIEPIDPDILTPEQEDTANDSFEEEEEEEETAPPSDEELSSPIGEYIDDGTEPCVSGNFKGLNIFVVIRNGIAELIINGYVCDSLDVTYLSEFELRAIVNDIDFIFDYSRSYSGETMYLYADDTLLDSFGRN